jgi:high-affinity nickel permease
VDFDFLFKPFEHLDELLTSMLDGEPLLVVLALAVLLGLRHASDPDHLVAVTSLVAAGSTDVRGAARIGAWWGAGHAATMVVLGLPLIVLSTQLPSWLETAAERLVGVVILLLAARLLVKWVRGGYRAERHSHPPGVVHRHLHTGEHTHAAAVGTLHGLAGTGAIVLLLIAALPTTEIAIAALLVFAPMSVLSMAAMTAAFAWFFTRPLMDPLFRRVLMPLMGALGLLFGAWYAGLA